MSARFASPNTAIRAWVALAGAAVDVDRRAAVHRHSATCAAAKAAHELGITSWALTGPAPNPLAALCDDAVTVESELTSTVQELHLVLIHLICTAVDDALGIGVAR